MDIPKSAIAPFMPLGVPSLGIVPYKNIIEALDEAFDTMNNLGADSDEPMNKEGMEMFLSECLRVMGAISLEVNITQFCHDVCDVNIYYMSKRTGNLDRYNCTVHSEAGFIRDKLSNL